MLTDEQLNIIGDAIKPIFDAFEQDVIRDVVRRIRNTMSYTRTAEIQASAMRDLGYSPAQIRKDAMKLLQASPEYRKAVAKNTLEYKREIQKIINNLVNDAYKTGNEIVSGAGNMSWVNDLSVWKQGGTELTDNSFLSQLISSISEQTNGMLANYTQTTGFKAVSGYESIENLYRRELDKAVIKVCSGTFTQDRAIKDIVHELAHSGMRSIDYASGRSMQLDTAASLAIRTGCHQLAGEIQNKNIEKTNQNLVYVTSHWGARNKGEGVQNHEAWQGKVYYIKPGEDYREEAERVGQSKIDDLWEKTGYSVDGTHENNPLGLFGYNCRHLYNVWFEGISTKPIEPPEPQPVEIDGKTYDYYAMTQKMRQMERDIRGLKRESEALRSLGMDDTECDAKISEKTRDYKSFCNSCGLKPQNARLRYEVGSNDLKKTKSSK